MDTGNNEGSNGKESQPGMDVLMDRLDFYRTVALVCFARLTKEEKIDAMLEVTELMKERKNEDEP